MRQEKNEEENSPAKRKAFMQQFEHSGKTKKWAKKDEFMQPVTAMATEGQTVTNKIL